MLPGAEGAGGAPSHPIQQGKGAPTARGGPHVPRKEGRPRPRRNAPSPRNEPGTVLLPCPSFEMEPSQMESVTGFLQLPPLPQAWPPLRPGPGPPGWLRLTFPPAPSAARPLARPPSPPNPEGFCMQMAPRQGRAVRM